MHRVKWLMAAGLLVALGVVAAASLHSRAAADGYGSEHWGSDRVFSNRSIKGAWGFSTNGFGMALPPTVPEPVPASTLGRIVFDGNGGCSISLWANFNGQTNRTQSATCSYTVNPDGTGTNLATFPGAPIVDPIPIVFVIVDEGREIRLMNTASIVSTITARRQYTPRTRSACGRLLAMAHRAMISDRLLRQDDPPVYAVACADGSSPVLLVCDHAGRAIPRQLGDLGLSASELATHVAWDLGIQGLGQRLAQQLDAFLIQHCYSRLVIDVNRPLESAESIVTSSERTRVPGNEGLCPAQARQRAVELFEPYHARISQELERRARAGRPSVLVALHSFTPRYLDVDRPWHAGVLYGRDPRLGRALLEVLRADPELVVGDNEPYALSDDSDFTVITHGEGRGILHVELEIRQDLLADEHGQQLWSTRLAALLQRALERLFPI